MSLEWVKKNVKVFSKDLDLKTAQKIPGLRAVFGESYPDPVRVVTLEYDVEEIAKDVENPKWRSTSVEFCGGTYVFQRCRLCRVTQISSSHVAKTGDIKDFVITEESGIAKGIRRIIVVTGHEAQQVTRRASDLKTKLDRLDHLTGKDKDTGLKAFTVVCSFHGPLRICVDVKLYCRNSTNLISPSS
jgi:alanyl-tRNA synthetase